MDARLLNDKACLWPRQISDTTDKTDAIEFSSAFSPLTRPPPDWIMAKPGEKAVTT
jgi:hypothetical protein